MSGMIFDIKEMAVHDGPGIRTTVFFKGCPIRCRWCHNPEGFSFESQLMYKSARCADCGNCRVPCEHPECQPFDRCVRVCPENCLEIVGRNVKVKDLSAELRSTADVLGEEFGGFTFSGGEPLAQPAFLLELIRELSGFHLCVETSGFCEVKTFQTIVKQLDFVIMDLKLADPEQHKRYTGVDNTQILENFQYLKQSGIPFIVRTPLIPDITDTSKNLSAIKMLVGDAHWERIPYNTAAGAKYPMLNMTFELK